VQRTCTDEKKTGNFNQPPCEHSDVRLLEVATVSHTDTHSSTVAGHVVWSCIIVEQGCHCRPSATAATSHEAPDMDTDDMQSGPLSCSPGRSPQCGAHSSLSSSQVAMQPLETLVGVVRRGCTFEILVVVKNSIFECE
jgi:hypothetical protein